MKKYLLLFLGFSLILGAYEIVRPLTVYGDLLCHIDSSGDTTVVIDSTSLRLYRESTVGNDIDGKPIILYRQAAEGRDSIIIYIDANRKARIKASGDTLFIDYLTVSGVLSAPVQWIHVERTDTTYATECPLWGTGIGYISPALTAAGYFIEEDGDNFIWGMTLIHMDSMRIDSIKWDIQTNDSDEDTLKFGYLTSDGVGDVAYTSHEINTLLYNNSGWAYHLHKVAIDVMIHSRNRNFFPYISVDDKTFGECRILKMITYSQVYQKRYGIPVP